MNDLYFVALFPVLSYFETGIRPIVGQARGARRRSQTEQAALARNRQEQVPDGELHEPR